MRIKRFLLLFLLMPVCLSLFSQSADWQHHSFAIRAGYGNMLQGTKGLTNSSKSYEDMLSHGITWDVQYYYRPLNRLGIGLLYSGFTSKGKHDEGSDHLYTHYIAPQIGLYCLDTHWFALRFNAGVGGFTYLNDGKVFGKSRRAKGGSIAANIGINAAFKISPRWGIETDIGYMFANLHKLRSHYHDEVVTVHFPDGERVGAGHLNLSAGISFFF